MSRVLKFRVWEIDDKCWGNLAYLECCGPTLTHLLYSEEPEKYIIEQCSGLKDSQGQEIYEGDFVEWKEESLTGSIQWSQEDVAFVLNLSGNSGALLNPEYASRYTIIGNIHENSNLL